MASLIDTWFAATSLYPANSDIWWTFKNASQVFDPATTLNNVTLNAGPAPKGFYITRLFIKERGGLSGLPIPDTVVTTRPRTGTWFSGRVWYAGIDHQDFTENLYFSQTIVTLGQLGKCYQTNDPTSETLADLLPTDGGVIKIQGCGAIYKLFPIQNGMLVFTANGIWFITGGSSVGFTATDYTITKISGVRSISSTSFIDVNGFPIFWNEEGIYEVVPAAQDKRNNEQLGLVVNPLTLGTILSFYNEIPLSSKKYARGSYNPITYIVKWTYRSKEETGSIDRYNFDRVLNYNIANKAFYPYSIDNTGATVNGVTYVEGPGGSSSPSSTFKYITSKLSAGFNYNFTFAEEKNTNFVDWHSVDNVGKDYSSYFVTGYNLKGSAVLKFQPLYVYMYHRNLVNPNAYSVQGIWDFAISPNTGRYSVPQIFNNNKVNYDKGYRRIKIRGHGHVLQFKVISVGNLDFDIMGWAVVNDVDSGI